MYDSDEKQADFHSAFIFSVPLTLYSGKNHNLN